MPHARKYDSLVKLDAVHVKITLARGLRHQSSSGKCAVVMYKGNNILFMWSTTDKAFLNSPRPGQISRHFKQYIQLYLWLLCSLHPLKLRIHSLSLSLTLSLSLYTYVYICSYRGVIDNFALVPITSWHYSDVIMSAMASQITSLTIVYSTVCLFAD